MGTIQKRRLAIGWISRAVVMLAILFGETLSVSADDDQSEADGQKAETAEQLERKERYTNWMRKYAEGTEVQLPGADEQQRPLAKLVANPVFRYSDEEHMIPDATLWVWTHEDRPVAFQKVEGNNHGGGQKWTICFTSLSDGLIKVRWPSGNQYAARKAGVEFQPIPQADKPADSVRGRNAQIKALKERFDARLGMNAEGKGGAETRTIPKPLFEYVDPESKLPVGAVFGMTSTGTNPNLLLLIEVRKGPDGEPRWEYAHARMTSSAVRFRFDNDEIWAEEEVPNAAFDNWTYYFLRRDFK